MSMNIFISHSHSDKALADALDTLVGGLFGNNVDIRYSSDRSTGRGIQPGESWLAWILKQVKECDLTIVMCTPDSVERPWLMWESGAVAGTAMATQEGSALIIPIAYRLSPGELPSPLRSLTLQSVNGEEGGDMKRVLDLVHDRLGNMLPERVYDLTCDVLMDEYLDAVKNGMNKLVLHERSIMAWIDRLDELKSEQRDSEVKWYHSLMALEFFGDDTAIDRFIDVRLHRRLGDLYLDSNQGAEAAQQFLLALQSDIENSRDVFLLHRLGLSQLAAQNLGEAANVVDRIESVSKSLVEKNPEIAGFKARIYRERWNATNSQDDLRTARDTYWNAMQANPSSYYMADNAGQLSLALDEREKAEEAFRMSLVAIQRSGDRSVWAYASSATAAIVTGDSDAAIKALGEIAKLAPNARSMESIRDGLTRLRQSLDIAEETYALWMRTLDGLEAHTDTDNASAEKHKKRSSRKTKNG